MKEIKSLQHRLIKHLVHLRKNSQYRKHQKTCLITGYKIVNDAAKKYPLKRLFLTNTTKPTSLSAEETVLTSNDAIKKITNINNPEPICAEISIPTFPFFEKERYLLLLDHITDPGNMGNLLRSCYCLGWDGVILMDNCADPLNDKAIRSSKGACFFIPWKNYSFSELKTLLLKGFNLFCADLDGDCSDKINFQLPLILTLGNESHGINPSIKKLGKTVTIFMERGNSLNVALAGGILMHTIKGKTQ